MVQLLMPVIAVLRYAVKQHTNVFLLLLLLFFVLDWSCGCLKTALLGLRVCFAILVNKTIYITLFFLAGQKIRYNIDKS